MRIRYAIKVIGAAALLATAAAGARAQAQAQAQAPAYPVRPVTLSVGYAAGGSVDTVARILADELGKRLKQRVVVENRGGASGMVSATAVARAEPDGHTLGLITTSQLGTNPHLFAGIAYKREDFLPIAMVVKAPLGLGVANAVPAGTVAEFQAYARENSAKMTYGSFGLGTNAQLVNEVTNARLGFDMTHAPYTSGGAARTDLMEGRIQVLVDALATLAPLHAEKKIKIIANFDEARAPFLPDVPTFKEAGFPDLTSYTWFGIVAPKGTPRAVADELQAALASALESKDVREKLETSGFIPQFRTGAQLEAEIGRDYERWGPVIRKLGIALK